MRSDPPFARGVPTVEEAKYPQTFLSEMFVLSSFMRNGRLFERHPLEPEAFTRRDYREIYRAMVATGAASVSVFPQDLADRGLLERVVFIDQFSGIVKFSVGHDKDFSYHLEFLVDRHARRKVVEACRQAIAIAKDCSDPAGLATAVELLHSLQGIAPVAGRNFTLHPISEIEAEEPARDFVEGLFSEGGASVVYGESNVGKSFWVLDIAAHVAMGRSWRNSTREVDRGAVVYVALEGTHGLRQRIKAMKLQGILSHDAPLYVCFSPVSLRDPAHAARLAETVKTAVEQSGLPCRLVIIDTLARAIAGGDENSSRDMTAAVAGIDAIRSATGAHVCIVHHCGKDIARGARGHSSLRAAVDPEVEIFRPEGERISTVRVTKQRDRDRGDPMPFSLTVVELGQDSRGKPITSCIVNHESETTASKPKSVGRQASYNAEALLDYLPVANTSEWLKRAKEDSGISNGKFYELKAVLQKRGSYRVQTRTGKLIRTALR